MPISADSPPADAPDLSVVAPVYRNRDSVERLATEVLDVTRAMGVTCEIVFVNDASPDDSLERLIALTRTLPAVRVIGLARNVGQHAAVLHGLAHARGRTCVVMDADLQDRPSSLPTLWQQRAPGVLAVFGGRVGRYEGDGRHLTSRVFKWLLHRLTGVPRNAGIFVLLEREAVDAIVRFPTRTPWIQAMVGLLELPAVSVPIERDRRPHGRSSYSGFSRVRAAARGVWCVLEYRCWPPRHAYLTGARQRAQLWPNRSTNSS
jgi:glycosyltransferase involved in cell wall biosynthesis